VLNSRSLNRNHVVKVVTFVSLKKLGTGMFPETLGHVSC
jgi:hypothetical protein